MNRALVLVSEPSEQKINRHYREPLYVQEALSPRSSGRDLQCGYMPYIFHQESCEADNEKIRAAAPVWYKHYVATVVRPDHDVDGFDAEFGKQLLIHVLLTSSRFATYDESREYLMRTMPLVIALLGTSAASVLRSLPGQIDVPTLTDAIVASGFTDPNLIQPDLRAVFDDFRNSPDSNVSQAAQDALDMLELSLQVSAPVDHR